MSAERPLDPPLGSEEQARITDAVRDIAEHRAVIEQAKGMLMCFYDIDADTAFDVLKWLSQSKNVKLRAIAEHLVCELPRVARNAGAHLRSTCDQVLLHAGELSNAEDIPKTLC